jgi:hypothetical protein
MPQAGRELPAPAPGWFIGSRRTETVAMAWHLTSERRDAVVLQLLGKALHALEEGADEDRKRVARLWIERATEVIRNLSDPEPSPIEKAQLDAVEAVLAKISARLREGDQELVH